MASKYWLKLYYEMLDDPKIGQLRPALRWRFIECLLVAGECDDAGYLPDSSGYAWRVRADAEVVDTELTELAEHGLLSRDGGQWKVTKFAERQGPVSGAERWQRWNKRQQQQEYNEQQTDFKRTTNDSPNETLDRLDIDIDKNRIDVDRPTRTPKYEHPESETPNSEHAEARAEMVSAIAGVVKDTLALGINEADFEQVAEAFIKDGVTRADVKNFPIYWAKNSYYKNKGDKPALKTLLQEMKNSLSTSKQEVRVGGVF